MKYIITLVSLLLVGTLYFIFRPEPEYVVTEVTVSEGEAGKAAEENRVDEQTRTESARREAMAEEFKKLEKARRNLESLLNRLKVVFYGVDLPDGERKKITEVMKNGYAHLKNKKLLGAYSSIDEISSELGRIEYIYSELKDIEAKYRDL